MYIAICIMLLLLAMFGPQIIYNLFGRGGSTTQTKKRRKITIFANLIAFCAVFLFANIFLFTGHAFANTPTSQQSYIATAAAFISAALVTGLGSIGTGIAVSNTAAAAIGAISENENNFGKAMIFVAMAEGIAIYGLLISFMILGRV